MGTLNAATGVYLGDAPVDAVYLGDVKVWPSAPAGPVTGITLHYVAPGPQIGPMFSASGDYQVDWGDGTAVESFAGATNAAHIYTVAGSYSAVITPNNGQDLLTFDDNPTGMSNVLQPVEMIFNSTTLTTLNLRTGNAPKVLMRVEFVVPPPLTSCAQLFFGQSQLIEVVGSLGAGVTDFASMFGSCVELTTLPELNTSSGTDFTNMFSDCLVLATIPNLDTSSGTIFDHMFYGCAAFTTIPLLDTSAGTVFTSMFERCLSLTTIPLLNTSSGTTFARMFAYCRSLTTVPDLVTSSGTDFDMVFYSCDSLTAIPMFDTSLGTTFETTFYKCALITTMPLWNTSSGTNFRQMFGDCTALTSVPLLDVSRGTDFYGWFQNCTSLASVPDFNTGAAHSFQTMFLNCSALLAVPNLNRTSLVGPDAGLTSFTQGCASLTTWPAWDLSQVRYFTTMFMGCTSLTSIGAYGSRYSQDISETAMAAAAINTFLTNLGPEIADGGMREYITIKPGTGANAQIARDKGYTVYDT